MRPDHPSLASRLPDLDARLRAAGAVRVLATITAGLLVVQGSVVIDRAGEDGVAGTVEVAALGRREPGTPGSGPPTLPAPATTGADVRDLADATDVPVGDAAPPEEPSAELADAAATSERRQPVGSAAPSTTALDERDAAVATAARAPASPRSAARERFEQRFPAHARARQNVRDPRTTRWAVLIGVNEHHGRTRDNLGSRQDAEDLYRHLRSLGWAPDRMVLLTDHGATRENIVEALRWLARKTDRDSVAVVHYSGHTKQWHGSDADGDREVPDEAVWPTDNRFITDREIGGLLSQVRAGRLWFNVGACEAAGFDDWGTTGPNRIATYSSGEHQKSYEDPSRGNSVWGYYLIEEGLLGGHADADGDGNVTVEEAFRYATPRAHARTRGQSHGRQTPEVSDRLAGEFDLRIPPRPRPQRRPPAEDGRERCLLCPPASAAVPRVR